MSENIVIALIGLAGVLGTATIGYFKWLKERQMTNLAKRELGYRSEALSFRNVFCEWNDIYHELVHLFETTTVDRFLLFQAWNGELAPQWTTNIFQFREGNQTPVSYVNFELDEDYVDRLRQTIQRGTIRLNVCELPDSLIKKVYESEGVTDSVWFHVDSCVAKDTKSKSITYCSFSTHSNAAMTDAEIMACRRIVGRLKGMALSMHKAGT